VGELVQGQREQAQGLGAVASGASLVVLALVSAACAPRACGPWSPGPPARARPGEWRSSAATAARGHSFREGCDHYLAGEFALASEAFRLAAEAAGPGDPGAADALYWLGRSELALGRLAESRAALERAAASATGALRALALAALADVALEQMRPAEALERLDRIEREGLAGELPADELLFRRASALGALLRRDEAARTFERVASDRTSSLAADAAARAEALRRSRYEARAGVFQERPPAERTASALRECGLSARVETLPAPGREAFVVSLGRYADRSEAERAARAAAGRGFPAHVWP